MYYFIACEHIHMYIFINISFLHEPAIAIFYSFTTRYLLRSCKTFPLTKANASIVDRHRHVTAGGP